MTPVTGIYAAPFTPFNEDYSIDWDKIEAMAERYKQDQLAGVFINGTTGEFASLTIQERKQLMEKWKEAIGDSLQIIVHVGCNSFLDCKDITEHASGLGVDGFAALPPYYFKSTKLEELIRTTQIIASHGPDLPFYYYHIPSFTGVSFSMTDYLQTASKQIPNLAGVKYSHPYLLDVHGCLLAGNGDFTVFFGVDEMLLGAAAMGVKAAVGSTYNFAAPVYHKMLHAQKEGHFDEALSQQTKITRMMQIIQQYGGFPALKSLMELSGIDCGPLRPPSLSLTQDQKNSLRTDLERIGFFEFR